MVNAGFPPLRRYGFEMVDAAGTADSRLQFAINRKFTSNRMIRIPGNFSSI
jgi:hypothetical protein